MAFPILTSRDLRSLRGTFDKTSQELSLAAGYDNSNPYKSWENGKGAPTVNEFFEITAHCGLTPSESVDWLTAPRKDELLKTLFNAVRNRKPVVLLDEEYP